MVCFYCIYASHFQLYWNCIGLKSLALGKSRGILQTLGSLHLLADAVGMWYTGVIFISTDAINFNRIELKL